MRDDFTKFSTISQCFKTLIHPALMQRPEFISLVRCRLTSPQSCGLFFFSYPSVICSTSKDRG
ncbi:MAG: hypothetical protein HRU34_02365 [Richelia sp.]|nr:hypothetical protein [Richelia sp.]CDN13199.1 hypothetical protein RintRC_7734 [Richelia intracellularis]